jgi:hypothetical protein
LEPPKVIIIGGGPAGLTAAYALMKASRSSVVLEKDTQVGGHARTVRHGGFLFDVGGHRFFTKLPEIDRIWREVLAEPGFLRVGRLSRIFYKGRFFHYPLRPLQALGQLGWLESLWVVASYLRKKVFPLPEEKTLEQWMINRFGPRLFLMFFKSYTEKVWGLPCSEIGAEWAAQRIKNLTLGGAIRQALPLLDATTFLLLNGDSYCGVDLPKVVARHRQHQADLTLTLARVLDTRRFGQVETDADGSVRRFAEKENRGDCPGWINAGARPKQMPEAREAASANSSAFSSG